jgi:hypothetical protein
MVADFAVIHYRCEREIGSRPRFPRLLIEPPFPGVPHG